MSKKTRKQKREEERAMLAEFDAAVAKERGEEATPSTEKRGKGNAEQPEVIHCKRCKSVMRNGVCPTCGFTIYTPMAEEKRKKIKGIVTVVCVAVFIVLFFALGLYK